MTKSTARAAWLKELRTGGEHSAWRAGAEIIDDELKAARKSLDGAGLSYTARDLVRLAAVAFRSPGPVQDIVLLAKARLDCEGMPYTANDLIELVALLAEGMDFFMGDDDAGEVCDECAGAVRH